MNTKVILSASDCHKIWRLYTVGRLDISKEEMVPTYNLATKLAMFNFCKQLAGQLSEHGLVRGGTAKVTGEFNFMVNLNLILTMELNKYNKKWM